MLEQKREERIAGTESPHGRRSSGAGGTATATGQDGQPFDTEVSDPEKPENTGFMWEATRMAEGEARCGASWMTLIDKRRLPKLIEAGLTRIDPQ